MYFCMLVYSIVLALGILALWLNFYTLSPLAMGGVAGSMVPLLLSVFHVGYLLYKFCKKDPIGEKHETAAIILSIAIYASAIIGSILTAGLASIFPNPPRVGFALIGAIIGMIAPIAGLFPGVAIVHCADKIAITSAASATSIADSTYVEISQEEKVDECITFPGEEVNKSIIFPKVEKVFSVRETAV